MDTIRSASRVPRSHLYVGGDRADHLRKALTRGADGLILDLEDAVTPDRKKLARATVADWLSTQRHTGVAVWVRVNSDEVTPDMQAVTSRVSAIVVPKANLSVLREASAALDQREIELRIPPGSFKIVPLIESAVGLLSAVEMARLPRVTRLAIGRVDLAADLGIHADPDSPEFRGLMLGLVVASSAAGIAAPVAPISTNIEDLASLRSSTRMLYDLGFRGRTAIHPAQVAVINDVFTPSSQEVIEARELMDAFDRNKAAGRGAFIDETGRMVDEAVARQARDILARTQSE